MGTMFIEIKKFELKKQNILRIDFDADRHYFVLNTDRADFCLNGQKIIADSPNFLRTNDFFKKMVSQDDITLLDPRTCRRSNESYDPACLQSKLLFPMQEFRRTS